MRNQKLEAERVLRDLEANDAQAKTAGAGKKVAEERVAWEQKLKVEKAIALASYEAWEAMVEAEERAAAEEKAAEEKAWWEKMMEEERKREQAARRAAEEEAAWEKRVEEERKKTL